MGGTTMFSVPDSKNVSFPDINYLWIGPPATDKEKLKNGMDVNGPIQMAQKNKDNKIKFWCLKEYAAHYENEFKGKNIEVCAVENLLEQKFDDVGKAAAVKKVAEIIAEHLKEGRNKIRDRVMIKNAVSILLLRLYGGYVMDTNNMPANSVETLSLPAYAGFKFPLVEITSGSGRNTTTRLTAEIWRLFSLLDDEVTKKIFDRFISNWEAFNKMFQDKKLLENFVGLDEYDINSHDIMANTLIEAISYYRDQCDPQPWIGVLNKGQVIIGDLIKTYNNTHKCKSNKALPFFFKPKEKKEEGVALSLKTLESLSKLEEKYNEAQIVLLKNGNVVLFDSTSGSKMIKTVNLDGEPIQQFSVNHSVRHIVQLSDESLAIDYADADYLNQNSCISIYKLDGEFVNKLVVPDCKKLLSLPDNMLAICSASHGSEGISIGDTIGNLYKKIGNDENHRGHIVDVVLDDERNFIVLYSTREIVKFNSNGVVLQEFNIPSNGFALLPLKDNRIAVSYYNKIDIYDMNKKEPDPSPINHDSRDLYNQSHTLKYLIEKNELQLAARSGLTNSL